MSIERSIPFESFGESEIENLHCVIRSHLHVGRFEIPVHNSAFVGVFQGIRDLFCYTDCLIDGNRARLDAISERRTFHELHHQRTSAARIFEAIDRSDVGMIERGEDFGFALEASHSISVACESFWQNL